MARRCPAAPNTTKHQALGDLTLATRLSLAASMAGSAWHRVGLGRHLTGKGHENCDRSVRSGSAAGRIYSGGFAKVPVNGLPPSIPFIVPSESPADNSVVPVRPSLQVTDMEPAWSGSSCQIPLQETPAVLRISMSVEKCHICSILLLEAVTSVFDCGDVRHVVPAGSGGPLSSVSPTATPPPPRS